MRARLVALLFCALTFSEAAAQQWQMPGLTCTNIEQCLTLLQKPYSCIPDCPGGEPLGYSFIYDQDGYFSLPARFERPSVLALLKFLNHPDLPIRARVLSDLSTLTPADLPALLQESRNGNEWIDPSDCIAIEISFDPETGEKSPKRCVRYSESADFFLKEARLRTIAKQGLAGRKHTSYVLELLKDENWDVRAEAAKTLGLTGEIVAIPDLIAAVSARDWRLTFEAMTSLKKLKAPEADTILKGIAGTYWHPAIAAAARDLLDGRQTPVLSLFGNEIHNYCEARVDHSLLPKCTKAPNDTEEIERLNRENKAYAGRFTQEFLANPALKGAKPLDAALRSVRGNSSARIMANLAANSSSPMARCGRVSSRITFWPL